jgi:hypothetical protein
VLLCKTGQSSGQAAREIEEVQLGHVRGETAQFPGHRGQQGVADRGLGSDQDAELVARKGERLGGF